MCVSPFTTAATHSKYNMPFDDMTFVYKFDVNTTRCLHSKPHINIS